MHLLISFLIFPKPMLKSCADEEVPSRFELDLVSLLMKMTEMTQRLNLILLSIKAYVLV